MPNKLLPMNLSPEEAAFLERWIYDEVHYQEGPGPAKQLQLRHQARPADLAVLIAAAFPDPTEQEAASRIPSQQVPVWPWSEQEFQTRLAEARALLGVGRPEAQSSAKA